MLVWLGSQGNEGGHPRNPLKLSILESLDSLYVANWMELSTEKIGKKRMIEIFDIFTGMIDRSVSKEISILNFV